MFETLLLAGSVTDMLANIAKIAAAIIGILMMVMLIKHAVAYAQGTGSVGKIVVDAIVVLLMIGLVGIAQNADTLMNNWQTLAQSATDSVKATADQALG